MIRLFTIYIGLHMWPRLSGEFKMFDERIYFQMIKESGKKIIRFNWHKIIVFGKIVEDTYSLSLINKI